MKTTLYLFAVLSLLASSVFADTYRNSYVVDNWLEVTRTVQNAELVPCMVNGITGVCGATGAVQTGKTSITAQTTVNLVFKNIGTADREDVTVSESLSLIPRGAQAKFSPVVFYSDGSVATWSIGSLPAGQSKTVSYSFLASLQADALEKFPQPTIQARPLEVVLSAPDSSTVGEPIGVTLKSVSGQPVSGATIYVVSPEGSSQAINTGRTGTANFAASKEGYYTYNVAGYRLVRIASTYVAIAKAANQTSNLPVAAAATVDGGIAQALMSMLPIAAAMFVMAIILLLVYNFLSAREEDDGSTGAPPAQASEAQGASPQGASLVYTQKFSFAEDAKQEKRVSEVTRDIIGSRKRQIRESEEKGQQDPADSSEKTETLGENEPIPVNLSESQQPEETREYSDESEKLAALTENSSEEGESTKADDESIEATIARLEEIRARLRAAREASEESSGSSDKAQEGGDEGAEEKPAGESVEGEQQEPGDSTQEETTTVSETGEEVETASFEETMPRAKTAKKAAKRKVPRHKPSSRKKAKAVPKRKPHSRKR